MFCYIGIDIRIIVDTTSNKELLNESEVGTFESITFETVDEDHSLLGRVKRPGVCLSKVKTYLDKNPIDIAIMGSSSDRFKILYSEIKKRNIPVILESCEWYHYSGYRGGIINPWYIQFHNCWKNEFKKADGFIVISRLLEKHYRQYSQKVMRIPTILDTQRTAYNITTNNERMKLIYAGNPGKTKELIANIIIALSLFGDEKNRFVLNIYGPNRDEVSKQLLTKKRLIEDMKGIVHIHGKVPQKMINDKYMQSDFGIFLREESRKNNAGFPTKLAESMVAGTPVIANDTGDIGVYLKDGNNGFLLKDSSPESIKEVLNMILSLNDKERKKMRLEARKTTEGHFDYRVYKQLMSDFLQEII